MRFWSLGLAAILFVTACGDDDDAGNEAQGGERLFAMGIRLRLPDGTTSASYLKTYTSLDGVTEVAVDSEAREFTGQRRFTEAAGGLLVESTDQPTITRWNYDRDSGLVEGSTLSLIGQGFTSAGITFVVDDAKAYSVSFTDLRVAIFDPVTLELLADDPIDLSSQVPEGFFPNAIHIEQSGGRVFIAVAFADVAFNIAENITVLVLDASADVLLSAIEDTRCHHAAGMAKTSNGDIYVLGDNGYNVLRPDTTSCVVRIASGTAVFDADYLFQPAVALGNREASELYALAGDMGLTFALHVEALNLDDPTSVIFDPVRTPWLLDLAAKTAQPVANAPLTKIGPLFATSSGMFLATSEDFDATSLYALDVAAASTSLALRSEGQLMYLVELP